MYTCSVINRYWKFVIEMINDKQIKKIKRKKKQQKNTPPQKKNPNEQTKPNPQNKPIYIDLILQSLKSMHVLWIDAKKKKPHEYQIVNWSNFFLCRKYSNAIEIIFSIALIDLI